MAYCPNCGIQVDENVQFCRNCGTSIADQSENQKFGSDDRPIPNYFVKSILVTLICCPVGIVPLIYSFQVDSKLAKGDRYGAIEASNMANKWANFCLIATGVMVACAIGLFLLGALIDLA